MNKIHRVVKNRETGQWVVVSELTNGVTKSGSKTLKIFGSVLSAFGVTFTAMNPVMAADIDTTTNNASSPQYLTGAAAGDNVKLTINGTSNINSNTTGAGIKTTGTGDAEFISTGNLSVNNQGNSLNSLTTTTGHGVSVHSENTASASFSGITSITLGSDSDTGLLVNAHKGGNVEISGRFDLTNNSVFNPNGVQLDERDGIEVNVSSGLSKLNHIGEGTINVKNGNAIFMRGGVQGGVDVNLASANTNGILLNTSGDKHKGISATTAQGSVKVHTNAKITTTGNAASGIYSNISGTNATAKTDLRNTGDISTSGSNSHAIEANSASGGKIEVTNSGNLTTSGTESNGIRVNSTGAHIAEVSNSGNITTSGARSHAIYVNADGNSQGIDINQTGGTISTSGYDAHGIFALTKATTGDINVNLTNTTIIAKGGNSDGIDIQRLSSGNINQVSNVNINVTTTGGRIETLDSTTVTGGSNYGIVVHQYDAAQGDINITNNGTTIATGKALDGTGANSNAISAEFKNATATGNININNNGNLSTQANNAHVINAVNNGSGNITIDNTGNLVSAGNGSSAIKAISSGGDIEINHKAGATITSTGDNSTLPNARNDAINATNSVGSIGNMKITIDGDITTAGAERAAGAHAQNFGIGDATVIGTGNITTTGLNSTTGVNLYSYGLAAAVTDGSVLLPAEGNATIGYSVGTITTGGDQAHALYASVVGKSGNVNVTNSGTLITTGQKSYGIWARNETTDLASATSGLAKIVNSGNVSTSGDESHVLYANSHTGNVVITNTGNLTTSGGAGTSGIRGESSGTGKIEINHQGVIDILDDSTVPTYGIRANISSVGDTEGINITLASGSKITTNSTAAGGISASSAALSGDINVDLTGTIIDAKGNNADGINLAANGIGSNVNINVVTRGGEIKVLDNAIQNAPEDGDGNFGIVARQNGANSKGNISIDNQGTKISTGLGADGQATLAPAIDARITGANSEGNIFIQNTGELSTKGTGSVALGGLDVSSAIYASNVGIGSTTVKNFGQITTEGNNAAGILARNSSTGDIFIENNANITTLDARGIHARAFDGDAKATVFGNITTGQASANTHAHGIDVGSSNGTATVGFDYGVIKVVGTNAGGGNAIGIAAWDSGSGSSTSNANITLGSHAIVDASEGVTGLQIRSNGIGKINIAQGAQVIGGMGSGIDLTATGTATANHTVNNSGFIGSQNDLAIAAKNTASLNPSVTVNNDGIIDGYVKMSSSHLSFNNNGEWNLRNFADTDGDGVRDTKGIAISDLGAGIGSVVNTGKITVVGVSGAANVNTTGQYIPQGVTNPIAAAKYDIHNGVNQAQLLNVNKFDHQGVIDLTGNGRAGDVLLISGGTIAGTNGGGEFVSNGGSIIMDAVLNSGGAMTQGDRLVVDNSKIGVGGATQIHLNIKEDAGDLTQGDGIQLIEVLGTSGANDFVLAGGSVMSGLYEYTFGQGRANNSWYLRNNKGGVIFYNPSIGAYLGNQYAASNMFMQSIVDRRDAVYAPDSNVWTRMNYNKLNTDIINHSQTLKIDTKFVQIGADLGRWGNSRLGVFGGYGKSDVSNRSNATGSHAKGNVEGYQLGVYGSWIADSVADGLYVDTWAQYGWYDNKLNATRSNNKKKYNSTSWSVSGEVGYGFNLRTDSKERSWIFEPHAQLVYTSLDADNVTFGSGSKFSNNKANGVRSRLGARYYGMYNEAEMTGLSPFVEANWLYDDVNNKINVGKKAIDANIAKSLGEVKFGFEGRLTKGLTTWIHIGGQWGENDYSRYEGQVGLGYSWK